MTYRSKVGEGVIRALLDAGKGDGDPVSVIDASRASEELLNVLALLMHGGPDCASPSSTRRACDRMARSLQARISEMQRIADAGGLPFVETMGTRQ